MNKQIIEAISKAFNSGYELGKDPGCINPYYVKEVLKQQIESALRKLNASQQKDPADAKPCPGFDCKTELRPFTLHVPGCSRCR